MYRINTGVVYVWKTVGKCILPEWGYIGPAFIRPLCFLNLSPLLGQAHICTIYHLDMPTFVTEIPTSIKASKKTRDNF